MPMRFNRVGIIFQKGYDMKCQRMKKYFYIGLSAFMSLYLSLCSCIGSYASTDSGASNTMSASNWLQRYWDTGSRWICDKYVVGSDAIYGTFADFLSWSINEYGEEWMDDKEVTIIQNLGEQEQYVVPDDVQEVVQEYVQYNITQNPLGYTECYIASYNFLDTSWLGNFGTYQSIKQAIKNSGGYGLICAGGNVAYNNYCYLITIPKETFELGFYGTTLSGGFNNVQLEHSWNTLSSIPIGSYGIKLYQFQPNSSNFTQVNSWSETNARREISCTGVKNNSSYTQANGYTSYWTILTNTEKNELVYVFSTLNALKSYSAGSPQPYYLTSEGLASNDWSANSGICNSGTMNNSGNYYSTVTNGVGTNWTPDQILALVDKVTSANGGSGGSSDSDKDTSKMWDRIGNAIGNLIDGIITVFTTIIEKLSDALLSIIHLLTGYTDDNGVVHEGLFTRLTSLVNTGFSNFISSIFSWLPEEIVTLLSATLVFGIFFGIFKMLRR